MFWAPCGSWGGGAGWMGVGGGWGVPPTHVHMHACTRTHTHACVVNMIIPCKWLLPLDFGEIPGIPYDVIHACACVCTYACVCMCVGGDPVTTPYPHPPTPQPLGWGTPGISQNSIALELIKIFQFCLKI